MIQFQTSLGGSFHRVLFSPRPGTSRGTREICRQLVYGYMCPFCHNPILFAFLTPEKVSLRRYEESLVVNASREIRRVIPGENSANETAYQIDWIPIPGRTMGLQRVRMKNHVLAEEHLGKKDAARQAGTRCCPYVAVFASRRDLLIKDTLVMGGFSPREMASYNLPGWDEFSQMILADPRQSFQEGIGPTPLVMVRVDWIDGQQGVPHWRRVLLPFKKPKPAESAEAADTDASEGQGGSADAPSDMDEFVGEPDADPDSELDEQDEESDDEFADEEPDDETGEEYDEQDS